MTDSLQQRFEARARGRFGWDDQKMRRGARKAGDYTDPEVQVAFDAWKMAMEEALDDQGLEQDPPTILPTLIHAYYKGLVEGPVGKDKKWTMGITTTHLEARPGSLDKLEDTRWMNQIECHGASRKEAEMLRDAVLGFLSQYNKEPAHRFQTQKAS